MKSTEVNIKTRDGIVPCFYFVPSPTAPAAIIYMDVWGIRPAMITMAERLAEQGYRVLLPDLFYRSGPKEPFNAPADFANDAVKQRFFGYMKAMTITLVMSDTASYLEFLAQDGPSAKVGCVGYCMGGSLALSAAGNFPGRIFAAASFHGGRLATDQPDSPHLLAPRMKAEIYIGAAAVDQSFPPEQRQLLEFALKAANVKYTLDVYPNTKHGFAVIDQPVFDRAAAEIHWHKLFDLYGRALR